MSQDLHSRFDVLNECWRLAALEVGNEPLCFVESARGTAEPDAMTADDDEVGWWHF